MEGRHQTFERWSQNEGYFLADLCCTAVMSRAKRVRRCNVWTKLGVAGPRRRRKTIFRSRRSISDLRLDFEN